MRKFHIILIINQFNLNTCQTAFPRPPTQASLLVVDSEGRLVNIDTSTGHHTTSTSISNFISHISYDPRKNLVFYSIASLIYCMDLETFLATRIYSSSEWICKCFEN